MATDYFPPLTPGGSGAFARGRGEKPAPGLLAADPGRIAGVSSPSSL